MLVASPVPTFFVFCFCVVCVCVFVCLPVCVSVTINPPFFLKGSVAGLQKEKGGGR